MRIEIQAKPVFWLGLTPDHVAILKVAAEWHYDATCNKAAQVGGFIYGWMNTVTPYEGQEETSKCSGSFRDLDLCLKIMEGADRSMFPDRFDQERISEMRQSFHAALALSNKEMSKISFVLPA